jgi:hypothetical protein
MIRGQDGPIEPIEQAASRTELSIVACAEGDYDGSQLITADALMRETEVLSADVMEGRGSGQDRQPASGTPPGRLDTGTAPALWGLI